MKSSASTPNEALRCARVRRCWTQAEVAERVGTTDLSVSRWERGATFPIAHFRQQLCVVFESSPEELGLIPGGAPRQTVGWSTSWVGQSPQLAATLSHSPHLPTPLTALLGREDELRAACALIRDKGARLVTLCGLGGVGKTRLALEVAQVLSPEFPGGVYFVPLAALRDPSLVLSTVAEAIGLREVGKISAPEALRASLRESRAFLLLDNFEHVAAAASAIAELVSFCPCLVVLVTSRVGLNLRGERELVVAPLAVPDPLHLPPLETLAAISSVALFVERVSQVQLDFQLTSENSSAVAGICARLDGLPLAVELAAARIRLFSPTMILARLTSRLALLNHGGCDLPPRQQTLRSALTWSYELLGSAEQAVFRRLGVFAGSCSLEAAEVVCQARGDTATPIDDPIDVLVRHHLLHIERGTARIGMLETIREYALEQLAASGEEPAIRRAHAGYYLALAQQAESQFRGPRQREWLERLERELHHLRAALLWALHQPEIQFAFQLASALSHFWYMRGYPGEVSEWLELVMRLAEGTPGEASIAACLEAVLASVIAEGKNVTYDLKPTPNDPTAVGTSQVADAVIARMQHAK